MKKAVQKKSICIILGALIIAGTSAITAFADTGPKPSVTIYFEGIDMLQTSDETYYATLLSKWDSTGPASAYDGTDARYKEGDEDYEVWKKFVEYKDTDNFYFLQEFWKCSGNDQLCWSYYPPSTFKILLYFPESDSFSASDIYETYAFDSYYTVDLSGEDFASISPGSILVAEKSYNYTWELVSLAARTIITVLIELAIGVFLFKFSRREQVRCILIVNIVTQLALNIVLNLINYNNGPNSFTFWFIVLEVIVFIVESAIYSRFIGNVSDADVKEGKIVLYAFTANAASLGAGLLLAHIIPGIF